MDSPVMDLRVENDGCCRSCRRGIDSISPLLSIPVNVACGYRFSVAMAVSPVPDRGSRIYHAETPVVAVCQCGLKLVIRPDLLPHHGEIGVSVQVELSSICRNLQTVSNPNRTRCPLTQMGVPGVPDHLTNIVFMGMGEPFLDTTEGAHVRVLSHGVD